MRERSPNHPASRNPRPSRRIHEETAGKLPDLTSCPRCGACVRDGRWTWRKAPAGSPEQTCPACERIEARYPAGVIHVQGAFAAAHRDELLGLIRHIEERERNEHPLKRIIEIQDEDEGFVVSVTDAKLAESFGKGLADAYSGELELPRTTSERENLVRVRWTRS